MQTLARNGVDLAYAEVGGGFPVVLHTGGAGSSSMWQRGGYVDRMPGFRLILLDHRGRGASSRPTALADHRVSEYVADVTALIDGLGCTSYGFLGYSFGGLVGMVLAEADPRLTGLAALGTVFDPPDADPAPVAYGEAGDDGGMAAVVGMIEGEEHITLPAWALAELMETDAEQFRLTIAANAGDPAPWDLLPGIGATTVLIAGSDEDPDRTQDTMAARMPSARSVHLPGVGHVGAFLRPDQVTAHAIPALRSAAATGASRLAP
jgi:pimeloyl-ACP methyl ester carboxylesterase